MADLDEWTKRAQEQQHYSVLLAVPATANPMHESGFIEAGGALANFGNVGLVFGTMLGGIGLAVDRARRLKNRKDPVGEKNAHEKVTLLFYEKRVDVHRRRMTSKKIGDLQGSYSRDLFVLYPEHNAMVFGDTVWKISTKHMKGIQKTLHRAGIRPGRAV